MALPWRSHSLPSLALAVPLLLVFNTAAPTPALAADETGIAACGNIDVRADATCEVVTSGGCVSRCEPVRFELACEGQCNGECTVDAEASCTGQCEADCTGECTVDPGQFDCEGTCKADCSGECTASCGDAADGATCRAKCQGRCTTECSGRCEVTPPEATCDAKCQAKCEGSCTARAETDCHVDCEGSCASELTGGCKTQCTKPEGALFCDGQYVDTGNNLDDCVTALEASLNIDVQGYATGSASCAGGQCTAEGEAGCSCEVPGTATHPGGYLSALAAAAAVAGVRGRRRGRRTDRS